MRRRAVIVAGMHRSGTSAVAHALALRGLDLPRTPMGPSEGNPLGHWGESEPIRWLHEDLLADAGSAWDDPVPLPHEWIRSSAGREWTSRMAAAFAEEYPGDRPLVYKDPRVCRLVPLWLEVFAELELDPAFVLPVRNPLEVTASLKARDDLDQGAGLLLWLRYVLEAERDTRGLARVFVAYHDLLRDWRSCLDRIAAGLDLAWSRSGPEADLEIERMLSAAQRHHEFSAAELGARADVVDWVKGAYGLLLEACSGGALNERGLDEVRDALDQADLAYGPLLAAERLDGRAQRERLEADLRELEDRLAASEAKRTADREAERERAAELDARVEGLARERDRLGGRLAETRGRLVRAEAERDQARREAEEARREAEEARQRGLRNRVRRAWQTRGQRRRTASQVASWLLRPPSRRGMRMTREFLALRRSPHFDRGFYLRRNADVANAGMDPVAHYIEHGARAGLDPSPHFATRDYLAEHPELAGAGVNPLWHFQRTAPPPAAPVPAAEPAASIPPDPGTAEVPAAALASARDALRSARPSVSVVVPTRDRAQPLRRAIDSALAQSYAPLEVIVSDDASADGTEAQVRSEYGDELADGRLRYLRSEERGGPSGARNRALAEARGDLVAYLDSDNAWHPDFLLLMAAALTERDDAAAAYCGIAMRQDAGGPPRLRRFEYDRDQLLIRNQIDLNAFVHRRRLYDQLGGFDEQLTRLVDWDLVLRYTHRYAPVEVPYCLVDYDGRDRPDRVTRTADFESNAAIIRHRFAHERAYEGQSPLRIGYVLWDYPALSQTFVLNEIGELSRRGYDVHVYHHVPPDRPARVDFDVPTFQVEDADELAGLLADHGRSVVHSHFAYPAVTRLAWPAARKAGIPFTLMVHAVDIFHRTNRERNRIAEIAADELCVRVFCYGSFHRSFLIDRGVPEGKVSITRQAARLPLASADDVERRLERERRVVATVARFVEKKGLDDLIRAATMLPADAEVRVYGYGPLEDSLRAQAAEAGAGNVSFMGALETHEEVAAALRDADVFALPCKVDEDGDMDGLPTVIGEAMAAGVPVVTTGVSAIPEAVADGVTGFVAAPGDAASIAGKIREALERDPAELRELIAEAVRRAHEIWGIEKTADALLEVWERPPLDVILVTHSSDEGEAAAAATTEILRRIFTLTTTPVNVTIVDNASDPAYLAALEAAVAGRENAALVTLGRNVHWGPAMNIALGTARSDEVVYVCSREGFILRPGWERAYVDHLRANRDVALAGHPISSPAFATGEAYTRQPWFEGFRNKDYAEANPEREFFHVQGGLFAIRRAAFERCGEFSTLVSQQAVDVEYSYYVESLGWKLGRVPRIPSVTVKTRPEIHAHLDEHTLAAHPLTLDSLELAERVAAGDAVFCNLCEWTGESFAEHPEPGGCPRCGSTPFGRLTFRYLATSSLPYRNLDCAAAVEDDALREQLDRMFELTELAPEGLNGALGSDRDVVIADLSSVPEGDARIRLGAIASALAGTGTAIIGGLGARDGAEEMLVRDGLAVEWQQLASDAVGFDSRGLLVARAGRLRTRTAESVRG